MEGLVVDMGLLSCFLLDFSEGSDLIRCLFFQTTLFLFLKGEFLIVEVLLLELVRSFLFDRFELILPLFQHLLHPSFLLYHMIEGIYLHLHKLVQVTYEFVILSHKEALTNGQ